MRNLWRAGRDSRASFARLRNEAKLRREPPWSLRYRPLHQRLECSPQTWENRTGSEFNTESWSTPADVFDETVALTS